MNPWPRRFAAVALGLTIGCATADHGIAPGDAETAFNAGTLSGAVSGRIGPAQTTNSRQITLTGVVANFTRLGIVAAGASPGTSTVFFSTRGDSGAPHLWRVNLDGSGLRQLTSDSMGQVFPSISRAGDRLVFRDLGLSAGQPTGTDLWEWTPGGGSRFLARETGVTGGAGWVPGDTAIVYPVAGSADSGIRERNLSGGPVLHLTDLPDSNVTAGLVDGVPTAFFARSNAIFRVDLTTHDTTLFHDEFLYGSTQPLPVFGPDLSRDGHHLLFWIRDIRFFTLHSIRTSGSDTTTRELASFPDRAPPWRFEARWSGDSTVVVTEEDSRTGLPQLTLRHVEGRLLRRLTDFPAGIQNEFSIGPFVPTPPRPLIGDGAALGASASGIIYGLATHGDLTTIVSFRVNRPRSVSLEAVTGLNADAPVLTYALTADRLTGLAYLADPPDGPAVPVIDSASAVATGALVTFDGETGAVALILPFAASTGARGEAITDEAGARVFRGAFTGVWQGGRNLASGGAREVRFEFGSGKVVVRE